MAICNSIPAPVADQISARLDTVACMLRSMRTLALNAESADEYEAVSVTVRGLSERAHLVLDACIVKMGSPGLGNYRDDEWTDGEGGAA